MLATSFLCAQAPSQQPSGFISLNGQVYVVSGNRIAPLNQEAVFRVTPNGFIGFNGEALILPDGAMIGMNGQLTAAPQQLLDVNGRPFNLPAIAGQNGFNGLQNANGNNTSKSQTTSVAPNRAPVIPNQPPVVPNQPPVFPNQPPVIKGRQ